ncbi:MAG: Uncharacterized protein XD58_0356 [Thermotoga sp. 50_1627]|uniref:hypothetical protein n=1 Tax=Pseudothermotoga sp. TaxID=2033661 RepID=UPI00076CA723|nr:MAG: Uncharacterized protein XD45_0368 [Thermotoga sp. 50_64]KUK25693.1 MAG: Uncharacterized protein XD58_0356 [Thermotoga sp. 50_1627]MBC7115606.1 hypothetical protein [Pseudothermotoga sp.]HBT39976.1 hypothetical protein [Pseudothermotoga sp.]HCO98481.1 hypothetical protein [Pseudothermotoga sp.]
MLLAVVLILAGLGLIIFGARVFFGVLFLASGIYLIACFLNIKLKCKKRREQELSFLREQLKGKLNEEDLEWVTSFLTAPIGRKFIIWVQERKENANVRISIPVSLVMLLRPFLNSLTPLLMKYLDKKVPFSLSKDDLNMIIKLLNSCLDEISTYRGDFLHIETQDATIRIGLM